MSPKHSLDHVQVHLVESLDEALAFKEWLGTRHANDLIAVDTETTGLEEYLPTSRIRLIQFGDTEHGWALPWEDWRGVALEALRQWEGDIVLHHAKYDVKWVETHSDFRFDRSRLHDTMVQAHLIDSTKPTGLKPLTDRLIDRRGSLGQQLLKDAFADNGWDWATIPVNFQPYWCVPLDTQILTKNGWKAYDELSTNDQTLGYDNGDLAWTRVTAINTYDDAPIVRVGSPSRWSTECTPQHRWLYRTWKNDAYGDVRIAPLDEIAKDRKNQLVLTGYAVGGESRLTPDETRVLTWLITDGHIQWKRPTSSPIAHIFQTKNKYHKEIRDLLEREGAYVSEREVQTASPDNPCYRFYVQAGYVTRLWRKAALHEQSLVSLVLSLSREARAAMLDTWFLADGHSRGLKSHRPRKEIACQKEEERSALALLAALEGHLPTFTANRIGYGSSKRPTLQKHQPTSVGRAPVWCPTTELGTWLARDRDGRIFVTGNSYGGLDTVMTAMLHDIQFPQVDRSFREAYDLEMAVQLVVMEMEQRGARVDLDYSREKYVQLNDYAQSVRNWCKSRYGFAMGSNGQLANWFEEHGCEFDEMTPNGQPKVDKDQLKAFAIHEDLEIVEVAKQTLAMRKAQKLASAYFGNIIDFNRDGVLHPSINTLAARTSRMSISRPALQQLPKGDATVRGAFIPREDGHVLISSDLDQVEFRMFAAYSQDPGLIQMFRHADATGSDAFTEIMRQVYRDPALDRSDKRRSLVKSMIYGRLYGAGIKKQAETAGVPYEQMKALAGEFDRTYPGVSQFQAQVEDQGKRREWDDGRGWIALHDGRKLYADAGRGFTLVNYCLQGGAASIFKRNLLRLSAAGLAEYMVVPVHDEIVMSVPESMVDDVRGILKECMTTTEGWAIPLTAGVDGPFHNWGEKYA